MSLSEALCSQSWLFWKFFFLWCLAKTSPQEEIICKLAGFHICTFLECRNCLLWVSWIQSASFSYISIFFSQLMPIFWVYHHIWLSVEYGMEQPSFTPWALDLLTITYPFCFCLTCHVSVFVSLFESMSHIINLILLQYIFKATLNHEWYILLTSTCLQTPLPNDVSLGTKFVTWALMDILKL